GRYGDRRARPHGGLGRRPACGDARGEPRGGHRGRQAGHGRGAPRRARGEPRPERRAMTLIVTGAAGFIGSNLVRALNERGERDIVAVDNLARADKVANLSDLDVADFIDKREFLARVASGATPDATAVLHQGACSDTMETDGRYMMENNYDYSLALMRWCNARRARFIYASSASVYGAGRVFREAREHEAPLNVYGYSKFLFDQAVRRHLAQKPAAQVAGFRYFNVYGPREDHKGRMASV